MRRASEGEGVEQERSWGVELDRSPSSVTVTRELPVQCESGAGSIKVIFSSLHRGGCFVVALGREKELEGK